MYPKCCSNIKMQLKVMFCYVMSVNLIDLIHIKEYLSVVRVVVSIFVSLHVVNTVSVYRLAQKYRNYHFHKHVRLAFNKHDSCTDYSKRKRSLPG